MSLWKEMGKHDEICYSQEKELCKSLSISQTPMQFITLKKEKDW